MTTTPTNLLFFAARRLRDAACGYAADLESGTVDAQGGAEIASGTAASIDAAKAAAIKAAN